jgi:hypothetical protein
MFCLQLFVSVGPSKSRATPVFARPSPLHGGLFWDIIFNAVFCCARTEHAPHRAVCCRTDSGIVVVPSQLHSWWPDRAAVFYETVFVSCHKYSVQDSASLMIVITSVTLFILFFCLSCITVSCTNSLFTKSTCFPVMERVKFDNKVKYLTRICCIQDNTLLAGVPNLWVMCHKWHEGILLVVGECLRG